MGQKDITEKVLEDYNDVFADIMNVEIRAPKYMEEAATIGGAILGGIALGIYPDEATALEKYLEIAAVTRPNPENVAKYARLKPIFEKIYEGLYDVYPDIYDAKKWLTGEEV